LFQKIFYSDVKINHKEKEKKTKKKKKISLNSRTNSA